MATRPLTRSILPCTTLLSATAAIVYHQRKRQPLLSDSAHEQQWPKSRQSQAVQKELGITRTKKSAKELYVEQEDGLPQPKDKEQSQWDSFISGISSIGNSISSIGDNVTDFFVPDWVKFLPGYLNKLQAELDMAPGSLGDEMWQESQDPYMNPEILRQATVRISKDLCKEELDFRAQRKRHTTRALAKYLGIREEDVHSDDVPTIAMCASGGGLRALTAGTSSYLCAQEDGLFDCVTYTAGVSGSCWLQALYNSSIGNTSHKRIIKHLKKRLGTHIAYPLTALGLVTSAPTNKFLLSGFVEKLRASSGTAFGLVDVYGLLLGARLLVPHGDLEVNDRDLKLSNQRSYIDNGLNPMPIYTAVRHELPLDEDLSDSKDKLPPIPDKVKEQAAAESWFQWFEFTPYEFFCEELDAGIPMWSLGRQFENGQSILRQESSHLPEVRIPLLMGIWGSAFCATLSHYYKEIRPLWKGLVGFGGMDEILEDRNDDLIKVHPITPSSIPSFTLGLKDRLPKTCPKSIFATKNLQLMDAGMSNNLPIYPLLRPGRNVDILIAFDASADIKTENWLSVADGYAKQRGIKGWPVGAGWPKADTARAAADLELEAASSASAQEAARKVAAAREKQRQESNQKPSNPSENNNQAEHPDPSQDLSYCTIWLGNTQERTSHDEPPPSKRVNADDDWERLAPDTGIAVIYFPFIPNPNVEGVDPNTSDFMSTWNFIYTPEEIDKVVRLARANYAEGKEMTRRCVRAVYERRKAERMRREEELERRLWWRRLREGGDHFR